jgi:ribosomal protein S18 acetylase RimI-like enzyme
VGDWLVREATEGEAEALAALLRAAFEEYRGRLDPPSGAHAETAETVRGHLKTARAILAFAGQVLVGCAFLRPEEGRLYVFRLAVLPAHRGRGLGRALLRHAEQEARARGLPRVHLGVRMALARQVALYESLGYRRVAEGTHAGYAAPTYLVFQKDVAVDEPVRPGDAPETGPRLGGPAARD